MTAGTADRLDRRLALGATGLLREFNEGEVLNAADVHVATRLGTILGEERPEVLLATALAVRAVRQGSVCVDLAKVAEQALEIADDVADGAPGLAWPDPSAWLIEVASSALVTEEVLRLEGSRLYLDRYWREERQVVDDLVARLRREAPEPDPARLAAGLDRVLPPDDEHHDYSEQREAVAAAARQWTTILTGGPGTGKTTTVAALLALVAEQHEAETGQPPRIALCAPTGKASARLQEAVAEAATVLGSEEDRSRVSGLEATTLHRLLGWRPESAVRFRHHRTRRLPYDVVVVDETSMVSLTMMARLLEAVRPDARLVLVGDADQLSSVEAGAVLADLVAGLEPLPSSPVRRLRTTHRYGAEIGALATALRAGNADEVMQVLAAGTDEVELVDPADEVAMERFRTAVAEVAFEMRVAADRGDEQSALRALARHRLLCAHREGRYGVGGWNRLVEQLVADRAGSPTYDEWYSGRPVLITANDRGQRLSNGDMGVTVRRPDGRLRVALAGTQDRSLAPTRLPDVQTMHAMTVHKSQGSQAETVSVVLPDEESRLLSRELFYTAVTRAQARVRVVGTEAAIRAAIGREVQRASGLRERLREALGGSAAPD